MLKRRIMAVVLVYRGHAVQSIGFRRYLPVSDPTISVEFFNAWGADEIVLLDIRASRESRRIPDELVMAAANRCFAPLTVGGGLRSVEDIRAVLEAGADKVTLNTAVLDDPALIPVAADRFGSQCLVASVDVRRDSGGYTVFADSGRVDTGRPVVDHARGLEDAGVGEILLNVIDRDGRKDGFEIDLYRMVVEAVGVPVIALGGAGEAAHFVEVFDAADVSAAAAANFFNFTEHSITLTKAFLRRQGIDVRLDSHARYDDSEFGAEGRLARRTDDYLQAQFWEDHPPEVI